MRMPAAAPAAPAALAAAAAGWSIDLDVDCTSLRALPASTRFASGFAAALSAEATRRLALIETWTGFSPGRDLRRLVIHLPDQGPPWIRLVGLPTERIVGLLARAGGGESVPDGHTAWPLRNHPDLRFVAITADQAVIVRRGDLAAVALASGPLPTRQAHEVWAVDIAPGVAGASEWRLLRRLELRGDGAGSVKLTAQGADAAGAIELLRRWQAVVALAGAATAQPDIQRLAPALASASVLRDQSHLDILLRVPADSHGAMVDALAARLAAGLGAPR